MIVLEQCGGVLWPTRSAPYNLNLLQFTKNISDIHITYRRSFRDLHPGKTIFFNRRPWASQTLYTPPITLCNRTPAVVNHATTPTWISFYFIWGRLHWVLFIHILVVYFFCLCGARLASLQLEFSSSGEQLEIQSKIKQRNSPIFTDLQHTWVNRQRKYITAFLWGYTALCVKMYVRNWAGDGERLLQPSCIGVLRFEEVVFQGRG